MSNLISSTGESKTTQDNKVTLDPDWRAHLTPPQQQAMEWLFNGGSIKEAAELAGVTRQTVSGWLHHDGSFKELYEAWQHESAEYVHARLTALGDAAMDNVAEAVRDHRDIKASAFVIKTLIGKRRA